VLFGSQLLLSPPFRITVNCARWNKTHDTLNKAQQLYCCSITHSVMLSILTFLLSLVPPCSALETVPRGWILTKSTSLWLRKATPGSLPIITSCESTKHQLTLAKVGDFLEKKRYRHFTTPFRRVHFKPGERVWGTRLAYNYHLKHLTTPDNLGGGTWPKGPGEICTANHFWRNLIGH